MNTNSISYINSQSENVTLDPSGTDYIDYSNNAAYFHDAHGINPNDENSTSLVVQKNDSPFFLSSLAEFTWVFKYKLNSINTTSIVDQFFNNVNYDVSFSNTSLFVGETLDVHVLKASHDSITYTISGDLTSADLSNADLTGTISATETTFSYPIVSGNGQFRFILDNTDISNNATILLKYWVKTVTNWAGDVVFAFASSPSGTYYDQPDLSFNTGDVVYFDVSNTSGYNLVFGTVVDDNSTVLDAAYVSETNNVITLDLTSYSGTTVYYFENTRANMGYVDAPSADPNLKIYINAQSDNRSGTSLTNLIDATNNATNVGDVTYYADIGGRGSYYLQYTAGHSGNASVILPDVLTSNPSNELTSFTFSIYYYTTADILQAYTRILASSHGVDRTDGYLRSINIGTTTRIDDVGDPGVIIYSDGDPIEMIKKPGTTPYNTWHHMCVTHDGTTTILYLNGVNIGSSTETLTMVEPLLLGAHYGGNKNYTNYAGFYFDAVHVYDTVLSASEVTALYNNPYVNTTIVHTVTVSNGVFVIDGVSKDNITFTNGQTYVFDQSDSTNAGFPIVFGTSPESSTLYTTGVTVVGTPGQAGAYTRIDYTGTTGALYYYSTGGSLMGYFNGYIVKTVQNWTGQDVFTIKSPDESDYIVQPDLSFNTGDTALFYVGDSSMTGYSLVFGTVVDDNTTLVTSNYSETDNLITLDLTGYSGTTVYYFEDSSANMGYVEADITGQNTVQTEFPNADMYLNKSTSNKYYFLNGTRNYPALGYSGSGSILNQLSQYHNPNNGKNSLYRTSVGNGAIQSVTFNNITYYASGLSSDNSQLMIAVHTIGNTVYQFFSNNVPSGTTYGLSAYFTSNQTYYPLVYTTLDSAGVASTDCQFLNNTISFTIPTPITYVYIIGIGFVNGWIYYTNSSIDSVLLLTIPKVVTVANGVFVIDGVSKPEITFTDEETYIFDQSDSTNAGFSIVFGTSPESSSLYTTGVTVVGTPGQPGAYTKLEYTGTTGALYYYSTGGTLMGYFNGYIVKTVQNWTGQDVFTIKSPDESDYIVQPNLSFNTGDTALFYVGDSSMTGYSLVFGTVLDDNSTLVTSNYSETDNVITLDLTSYSGATVYYFEDSSANMGYVDAPSASDPNLKIYINAQSDNRSGTSLTNLIDSTNNATNVGDVTYYADIGGRGSYYLQYEPYINRASVRLPDVLTSNPSNELTSFTFSIYYYTTADILSGQTRILGSSHGATRTDGHRRSINIGTITRDGGVGDPGVIILSDSGGTMINKPGTTPYNTWHHMCVTHDGTTTILYLNGVNIGSSTVTLTMVEPLLLGGYYDGNNNYTSLAGFYFDAVHVYDTVLSASEVTALYNNPYVNTTIVHTVTVSNGVFVIDGVSKPEITFTNGETYVFDQSDSTNAGFPIVFGETPESSSLYTTGVTVVGTPGQAGAYTKLEYTGTTGDLYYYNNIIPGMGNDSNTISYNVTVADTPPKFYLNSALQVVTFTANTKYYFYQYDSTNENYPIVFDETADDAAPYFTDDVTTVGTPGQSGAYTILDLSSGFTGPLVYFSSGAANMGFSAVYTVKVVQNWTGNNVFSIQAPGEDISYNQPDLSFNAGDSDFFDVGDSSMTGYTLVFGTEIDNSGTIIGSPYVSQSGTVISLKLPSDYTGGAVYYFENTNAGMGYVEAPEATNESFPKLSNLKIHIDAQSDNRSGTSLTNLIDSTKNATNVGDVTYYADIGGRGSYYLPYGQSGSGLTDASVMLPTVITSNAFTFSIYYYTTAATIYDWSRLLGSSHGKSQSGGHMRTIHIGDSTSGLVLNGNDGNAMIEISTGAPPYDTWHHLCLTHDGTTTILYLNGASIGSSTNALNMIEPLLIGAFYRNVDSTYASQGGFYFDAVHVYDTVLSASEVTALYNSPYGAPTVNTYTVTVSNEVFFIDTGSGAQSKPEIIFNDGETYVFDQSDSTNAGYPIVFGEIKDSTPYYTTGVTVVGTPGQPGAYTKIDYTGSTALVYFSSEATGMGYNPPPTITTPYTVIDPPLSKRGFSRAYDGMYEDSRLASTVGWAYPPITISYTHWIFIGNETDGDIGIVGVKIMPRASGAKQHITTFTAEYSSDNLTYYDVDDGSTFSTNFTETATSYHNQESLNYFATPVIAQYIRITPTGHSGYVTMRAGLIQGTITTSTTNVYTVTVSNEVFFIDTGSGAQSKPEITFTDGETYVFDQSDSTNAGYPIVFGETKDSTPYYTTGVTVVGTPGQPGGYTKIDYTGSTTLYYFSSGATGMGYVVPPTWTLLFRQTGTYDWYLNPATNSLNESDTSFENYSILNRLYGTTNYKNGDFYQFKYIDTTNNRTIEWKQTSNFVETTDSVTGYELISSTINPVPNSFAGLNISTNSYTYYDGNPNSINWWYSIARRTTRPSGWSNTFPAFESPYPQQIELWVYS